MAKRQRCLLHRKKLNNVTVAYKELTELTVHPSLRYGAMQERENYRQFF